MDIATPSASVSGLSMQAKLETVLRKTAALLPADIGNRLLALISPTSLAIMAGVVLVWAGSHFFGVGEIADVILLTAGWITIGGAALEGGKKLLAFAVATNSARNDADLDKAAKDLADAITILGVDVVLGLLLKGKPKGTFKTTFPEGSKMPSYGEYASVMPKAGPTRMYEARLIFTRKLYAGEGGTQLGNNRARIGRNFYPESKPLAEAVTSLRKTVYHERVHQRLTQALSLLGRPALYSRMSGYKRSYILRYIEEAAAESYGLAKTQGLRNGDYAGIQFPLNGKYGITVLDIKREAQGILLGPVTVGGATMNAYYGLIEDAR